jgi:hypothetical protein
MNPSVQIIYANKNVKKYKLPKLTQTWYLYTMEFYSAIKKNEILSFAGKWMEVENII